MELTAADPLIGTLIAERYRVLRKLGEGGMGVVYEAVHEALRKPVAIKLLAAAGRIDKEAVARFEREAIAAANLRHPNIAEATDFGRLPDGALYLVMEYVEGTTLRKLVREHGKLAPERGLAILQQVGAALATAHARDVVHRDLKPENVIVTSLPGGGESVKVIDFGIAKIRNATFGGGSKALTKAGTVFGTPEYMAPEQVMGQACDARADQYALGVLAFELLTGKPPFAADDIGQLMMMHVGAPVPSTRDSSPALSVAADEVITKMLGKLPDDRFTSVNEAIQALTVAITSPAASVSMPSLPSGTVNLGASYSGLSTSQIIPPTTLRSVASEARPNATSPNVVVTNAGGPHASGSYASAAQSGSYASAAQSGSYSSATQSGSYASAAQSGPHASMANIGSPHPSMANISGAHAAVANITGSHPAAAHVTGSNPAVPRPATPKPPLFVIIIGALSLLAIALLVVLVLRSGGGSSLPGPVATALSDWKEGKLAASVAALRVAVASDPTLAGNEEIARTLAASIGDSAARKALGDLLGTTALGRSTAMASALAVIAEDDDPRTRDGALALLRERQELLSREHGARVRMRDAGDCEDLGDAVVEATDVATGPAQSDLSRLRSDDCKSLLRVTALCDQCRSDGPGLGKGSGSGKGKGKKDKHR